MEKHVDVLGFLLTVVVFSVGFVSARAHSNYDATMREVRELSWDVRSLLMGGGRVGPSDLAELLSVVQRSSDPLARASRILNIVVLMVTLAVLGDAVMLFAGGSDAPEHALVLLAGLGSTAIAVTAIGEYDLQRVSRDQRAAIRSSTLGQLDELADALDDKNVTAARAHIRRLSALFPEWGLLVEEAALLDSWDGRPDRALERIRSLAASSSDLYLTPVLGAACAIAVDDPMQASELLAIPYEHADAVRYLPQMRLAIGFRAAHIDALLAPALSPTAPSAPAQAHAPRGLTSQLLGSNLEVRQAHDRRESFDVSPADFPATHDLVTSLHAWSRETDVDAVSRRMSGTPVPALLGLVLGDDADRDVHRRALATAIEGQVDPATVETIGLITLALGEGREAFRLFERAIRLRPASDVAQWGLALASHSVGWADQARKALHRAGTLAPGRPIYRVTENYLSQNQPFRSQEELGDQYPDGFTEVDQLQLSLIGIEVAAPRRPRTVREQFIAALIAEATRHAAVGHPEVYAGHVAS